MGRLDEETHDLPTRSIDDFGLDHTRWLVAFNNIHVGSFGDLCRRPYLLVAHSSHHIVGAVRVALLQTVGADAGDKEQTRKQGKNTVQHPKHRYLLKLGLGWAPLHLKMTSLLRVQLAPS